MHERYRELSAAASVGEAAAEELAELEKHLSGCAACRQAYSDFLNLAAYQYSQREGLEQLTSREVDRLIGSERMRARFLANAAEEGVTIPAREGVPQACVPRIRQPRRLMWSATAKRVAAAAVVAAAMAVSFQAGQNYISRHQQSKGQAVTPSTVTTSREASARLKGLNAALEQQMQRLKADLKRSSQQLARTSNDLHTTTAEDTRLLSARDFSILQLQQELADSEAVAKAAREESARLQRQAAESQASFISDESKIRDLSDKLAEQTAALARDHQLMQNGRDIRDLMVARNLHIVDVFDTDPKGKTKPAFGRIFLTEGKSLVFYAYDLNEAKVQQADYHYRIWGAKEGQEDRARSLGIFYSDDKAQRRWVFKCDDPKILNEIDSVFVTLEPPGNDTTHPRGQRMMDAYLRGLPNHP